MKAFGVVLMLVGILMGLYAYTRPTSTETGLIGAVHNFQLAERRKTNLMVAGVAFIAGVVLFGFGASKGGNGAKISPVRKCPYCAEEIRPDAVICRYCNRDVAESSKNSFAADVSRVSSFETWQCPECKEVHGVKYTLCWKCGYERG